MIRRYQKQVERPPQLPLPAGIGVRNFESDSDPDHWIAVHQCAFRHGTAWSREQFVREFCQKKWWNPSRMWFAYEPASKRVVGTVTLGDSMQRRSRTATVSWLAVLPEFQRRGIARALINLLERKAHEWGYEALELETLDSWSAAIELYASLGFTQDIPNPD